MAATKATHGLSFVLLAVSLAFTRALALPPDCDTDAAEHGVYDEVELLQTELHVHRRPASVSSGSSASGMRRLVQLLQTELHVHRHPARVSSGSNASGKHRRAVGSLGVLPRRAGHKNFIARVKEQEETEALKTTTGKPEYLGVSTNSSEDLGAFLASLNMNFIICACALVAFSLLRLQYEMTYERMVHEGKAPVPIVRKGYLDWYWAVQKPASGEIAKSVGLDGAMLLEFCDMAKDTMWMIGMPMLCFVAIFNCSVGGNAAGDDYLSYLSMGNVEDGNPLFYLHAVMVWYVIIVACRALHGTQALFMEMRKEWLLQMPDKRACAVYVENIPVDRRTDSKLLELFEDIFPGKVKSAHMVRNTLSLLPAYEALNNAKDKLDQARHDYEKRTKDESVPAKDKRPLTKPYPSGDDVDAIDYYEKQVARWDAELKKARATHNQESKRLGGVNGSSGFVIFYHREDALRALDSSYFPDTELCMLHVPPCATDINWPAVQADYEESKHRWVLGIFLILCLAAAFLPLVIGITNVANLINMGPLQPFWKAFAPTLGLTLMVSFLPTILLAIIDHCFVVTAMDTRQMKLQQYYFWFQLVFVVLATAVGQDLAGLIDLFDTSEGLGTLLSWLAETLPFSTHFFMNFLVLQCTTHCMNMLRLPNLFKYIAFSKIYPEDIALKMCEPEDQDYYGKGARSTRWTICLVIGLVYGTLSPLVNFTAWLNFWVCRNLAYGWLIPFAETRKPDSGGYFWMQMAEHTFYGLFLYWTLMVGVFTNRQGDHYASFVAGPSIVYLVWSYYTFKTQYMWERLPLSEMKHLEEREKMKYHFPHPLDGDYQQPELVK